MINKLFEVRVEHGLSPLIIARLIGMEGKITCVRTYCTPNCTALIAARLGTNLAHMMVNVKDEICQFLYEKKPSDKKILIDNETPIVAACRYIAGVETGVYNDEEWLAWFDSHPRNLIKIIAGIK